MNILRLFPRFALPGFALLIMAAVPALSVAEWAETGFATSGRQMHEHLQALDRQLRSQLLGIAKGHDEASQPTAEEVEHLQHHLRSLERRLHSWEDGAEWIDRVRAIQPLLDNLERAIERPLDEAVRAEPHRGWRVQWPATEPLKGVPANDDCADATPIGLGTFFGDTTTATADGMGCFEGSRDVWFAFTADQTGSVVFDTFGSGFDTVLSVHSGCPGTQSNEIFCNDNVFGLQSAISFHALAGRTYWIRVAGAFDAAGPFVLNVGPGGVIEGTVTDEVTGAPVEGNLIQALTMEGDYSGSSSAASDGSYDIPGLISGDHVVYLRLVDGYLPEIYDDVPCTLSHDCEPLTGTPIPVVDNETSTGIDFELNHGGSISGTVTESATGGPVEAFIGVWNGTRFLTSTHADSSGHYLVEGLPARDYYITASSFRFLLELYDDFPCPGGPTYGCELVDGTPVQVSFGTTTEGIDFALDRLGTISGTVSDARSGVPIATAHLTIYDESGNIVNFVSTDEQGFYEIGLSPGSYFLRTSTFGYFDELYDNVPCGRNCEPTIGTLVSVALSTNTPDIDFALDRQGSISGRFTDAVTGQPLETHTVTLYDVNGFFYDSGFTDAAGNYLLAGVDPGTYFAVGGGSNYIDEVYNNIPCRETCEPTSGTPITVTHDTVTSGVDFALHRPGMISGRVLHQRQPVTDAVIMTYRNNGELWDSVVTDFEGRYVVDNLLPGTYFVVAQHHLFEDELFDNLPCEEGCDPTTGLPIVVSASGTRSVDFGLGYCTPTATSLCLTGDRFRVEAIWEDFENQMGPAFAEGLTADAGTFWFFNPGNIELVVKILDVCDRPENRFWVFGAGLTDVGVELKVTDELTGEVVTYDNPVGTPYEPVLDTQAFATCDAGFQSRRSASVIPAPAVEALSLQAKGECVPDSHTLCLNGVRFQAKVTWQAPNGDGGSASGVFLADETGYFYFGGPENVEVVVKVLDACELASNKFWVFGAGLTNFEVTLTVTDTVSDVTRVYTNDQGNNFEAITDTSAFDTCNG